jgi:NSS family neurotransmitter:Na+ symporter
MARETWATRMGFILAAVGSAVGLGNVWRFPWMAAENGGSAFLLVYLLIVLGVGVPGLLGEFVVGRRSRRSPVGALRSLSGRRAWGAIGALSVFTALVLLSFYSVVGGWIVRYFAESLAGVVGGRPPYVAAPAAHFEAVAYGAEALGYHLLFLGITAAIVLGGVRRGIETATTVMMPAIVLLLIALAVWAGGRPGAGAGYAFYLGFDFATLRREWLAVLGPAAGQALFTLSLGVGTMLTYASYLDENRSLPFDASAIAVLNTSIGVLAGLVIFPLLFSQGVDPATTGTGPGALFVGIVGAFASLPGGAVVAAVFFGVVSLAAVSSSISMLEIPVAFLIDEFGTPRPVAVAACGGVVAVAGSATALDPGLFGFVAGTLVDLLLTAGLTIFLLFVGWVLGREALAEYEAGAGDLARALGPAWFAGAGVVLPVFLLFTLLSQLGVRTAVGFWPTVAAAALLALGAFAGLRHATASA